MTHLYNDGTEYFWVDDPDYEPRHRNIEHSRHCPCITGAAMEWEWNEHYNNYAPKGLST
jgi:hypothetical protein